MPRTKRTSAYNSDFFKIIEVVGVKGKKLSMILPKPSAVTFRHQWHAFRLALEAEGLTELFRQSDQITAQISIADDDDNCVITFVKKDKTLAGTALRDALTALGEDPSTPALDIGFFPDEIEPNESPDSDLPTGYLDEEEDTPDDQA